VAGIATGVVAAAVAPLLMAGVAVAGGCLVLGVSVSCGVVAGDTVGGCVGTGAMVAGRVSGLVAVVVAPGAGVPQSAWSVTVLPL